MRVKLHLDIDLGTGSYDLRVDSPSHPGAAVDADTLRTVVGRVMDNVVVRQLARAELEISARPARRLN